MRVVIFPVLRSRRLCAALIGCRAVEKSTKHVSARQGGVCHLTRRDGMKGARLLRSSKPLRTENREHEMSDYEYTIGDQSLRLSKRTARAAQRDAHSVVGRGRSSKSGRHYVRCSCGEKFEATTSVAAARAQERHVAQERSAALSALETELRENNRRYSDNEITRSEWVAANRSLDERGKQYGIRLQPFALTD